MNLLNVVKLLIFFTCSLVLLVDSNTEVRSRDRDRIFNPVILENGVLSQYRNEPMYEGKNSLISARARELAFESSNLIYLPKQYKINNLMNKGEVAGNNVVLGLALYKNFYSGFRRLVGSLRHFEFEYLKRNQVTLYGVETSDCHPSALNSHSESGVVRGKCSADIPDLKLEWGRFEMARRWLIECETCTGWSLILDTRDIFFQDDPFQRLKSYHSSQAQLLFIEEISPHTSPVLDSSRSFVCGNPRNYHHIIPCYGSASYHHYSNRPVLNSGTVIGTRNGLLYFLSILVNEFYSNNMKNNTNCKSPTTTDQWTMNWLYYNGRFNLVNKEIQTIPWGIGPILTVGKACMTREKKTGAEDLIEISEEGWIMNRFDHQRAAGVHQFDRCHPWIDRYFHNKSKIYL